MDTDVELPKLEENQKSFAGIPEAIFVVSGKLIDFRQFFDNLVVINGPTWIKI